MNKIIFILFFSITLNAQSVINPRTIEFEHIDYQDTDSYRIAFTAQGAVNPVSQFDIPKMNVALIPNTNPQRYTIDINSQVLGIPINTPQLNYTATIEAINSVGASGRSAPTNPFIRLNQPRIPVGATIR